MRTVPGSTPQAAKNAVSHTAPIAHTAVLGEDSHRGCTADRPGSPAVHSHAQSPSGVWAGRLSKTTAKDLWQRYVAPPTSLTRIACTDGPRRTGWRQQAPETALTGRTRAPPFSTLGGSQSRALG